MSIVVGRDLPSEIQLDICIIGAGAGGLSLASNFLNSKLKVGILESGGNGGRPLSYEPDPEPPSGLTYAPLSTCRLRGFGGSTQTLGWGGFCKPLDPQDFVSRPWVADSGWPFGVEHLRPFYDRARVTLGLDDIDVFAGRNHLFPDRSALVSADKVELCPNYRLGRHMHDPVERSTAVNVLTHVRVLMLEYADDGNTIRAAICADAEDRRFRVVAKAFVVAAGGIENARLLLVSNQAAGRPQGLVGAYFMDHPRFTIGTLTPANGKVRGVLAHLDRIRVARRQRIARKLKIWRNHHYLVNGLTLPFEVQEREKLLNYRAWVEPSYVGQNPETLDMLRSFFLEHRDQSILNGKLAGPGLLLRHLSWTKGMHFIRPLALVSNFRLHHFMEPEPLAASAVSLSSAKDRHGMPLASLSWQLSASTFTSLRKTIHMLQQELQHSGLGRLDVAPEEWEQLKRPMWTWHHMGTTRMHTDPAKGVVDADCRVHGVGNLFIAGSSVFPTVGNDTPTLTIVALAHRLADHVLKFVS
ncbi:GMC family oxidoreductase [Rhizobium sp. KVB221]|uniref:GMC family oxidoreductase n=1 Tax=Rhizobium setariae TaxID=2801340 RepID=A0A936YMP8_9HYPH|nr:GMC family oxidoreductase [Rhizobium setariae]MBL0373270.1 GMC family oxidoreductase [Rhizobium setariae]